MGEAEVSSAGLVRLALGGTHERRPTRYLRRPCATIRANTYSLPVPLLPCTIDRISIRTRGGGSVAHAAGRADRAAKRRRRRPRRQAARARPRRRLYRRLCIPRLDQLRP